MEDGTTTTTVSGDSSSLGREGHSTHQQGPPSKKQRTNNNNHNNHDDDGPPPPAQPPPTASKGRKRLTVACDTCRGRRTKCDGVRPQCAYCQANGLRCVYQDPRAQPESQLETDIASIKDQLRHITKVLTTTSTSRRTHTLDEGLKDAFYSQYALDAPNDFPFMTIKTPSMMQLLGLDGQLAKQLIAQERRDISVIPRGGTSRFFVMQQQRALAALAAFSTEIHKWYPILPADYSTKFLQQVSGDLTPSTQTCLALLVCAIGAFADCGSMQTAFNDRKDVPYFELALASLPQVLVESSVTSLQCLVLLSIYHCCLLKPCQAHDYVLIASNKAQTLLNVFCEDTHDESAEQIKRSFWAVLLIESELNVQFGGPDSGIWELDNHVRLPNNKQTWDFDATDTHSPMPLLSPGTTTSSEAIGLDRVQSYYLAEIAMRRMLRRCTASIRPTANGKYVFAPVIAAELELQLDEWYNYLPPLVRFDRTRAATPSSSSSILEAFLAAQYYSYKASIYWPAVCQAIEFGDDALELQPHCEKFFQSVAEFLPSASEAVHGCLVNAWTLHASIFIISMAAIRAMNTPYLQNAVPSNVRDVVYSAPSVLGAASQCSSSLETLYHILISSIS